MIVSSIDTARMSRTVDLLTASGTSYSIIGTLAKALCLIRILNSVLVT